MNLSDIEHDFRQKVCSKLRIDAEGVDRFRVSTPFRFDDGDHLVVVLKREAGHWILSDEGHTYMHLTYDIDEQDLHRRNRRRIITNTLSLFSVDDRDGELRIAVADEQYGDSRRSDS